MGSVVSSVISWPIVRVSSSSFEYNHVTATSDPASPKRSKTSSRSSRHLVELVLR
jgi:hypothetical protein